MLKSIATGMFALSLIAPPAAVLAQSPKDPAVEVVDPREDMRRLDDDVIVKQRELMQARRAHDDAAVKRLEKEFKELQGKRSNLVPEVQNMR